MIMDTNMAIALVVGSLALIFGLPALVAMAFLVIGYIYDLRDEKMIAAWRDTLEDGNAPREVLVKNPASFFSLSNDE